MGYKSLAHVTELSDTRCEERYKRTNGHAVDSRKRREGTFIFTERPRERL